MCPRTERPILAVALAMALASGLVIDPATAHGLAAAAPAGLSRADDTLEYLESRGLDELSVRRLEELARATEGEMRAAHLERLATLVARMLDDDVRAATGQPPLRDHRTSRAAPGGEPQRRRARPAHAGPGRNAPTPSASPGHRAQTRSPAGAIVP